MGALQSQSCINYMYMKMIRLLYDVDLRVYVCAFCRDVRRSIVARVLTLTCMTVSTYLLGWLSQEFPGQE